MDVQEHLAKAHRYIEEAATEIEGMPAPEAIGTVEHYVALAVEHIEAAEKIDPNAILFFDNDEHLTVRTLKANALLVEGNANARYNYDRKKVAGGIETLKKSLAYRPDVIAAHVAMVAGYRRLGDREGMGKAAHEVFKLDEFNKEVMHLTNPDVSLHIIDPTHIELITGKSVAEIKDALVVPAWAKWSAAAFTLFIAVPAVMQGNFFLAFVWFAILATGVWFFKFRSRKAA